MFACQEGRHGPRVIAAAISVAASFVQCQTAEDQEVILDRLERLQDGRQ